ncbi:F-box protein At5g07610-like isoform X1 [Salvia splendens]|uniref:F-box protein At5g07610-like isoform X1 n=1 Tax=Salvia splendens TaxID=180675 RepID=UPI001C256DE5|nr:F-box protein At5g07610-like isoform X1 [Salvia splendens]
MKSKKAKVLAAVTPEEDYGDRWSRLIWNNDLLTEIFVRLHAKYVTRCKLVCKHWLSLVSSENFYHLHILRCPNLRPSFILDRRTSISQFLIIDPIMNGEKQMIPYTFSVPNSIIKNSCNGLMLLQSRSRPPENSFHVYNPTTKLSRKVSVTDAHIGNNPYIVEIALAFDPSKSPHYKVVCIRSSTYRSTPYHKMHTYQIEVYDSESRAWKLRLGPFTYPKRLYLCGGRGGVYCNGSIYWENYNDIVYYDIARNEFQNLSMPDYPSYEPGIVHWKTTSGLQGANGCLYKSRCLTKDNYQSVELFELEMDDDGSSSWLLRYNETICQHEHTNFSYEHTNFPYLLGFIKGSYGTETCSVVSHTCGKISVYSFLDKSYKLLVDLKRQPPRSKAYRQAPELKMYEFIECLAVV